MIELYHWEPNGASGRVLIALEEKRLGFRSHYLDVLAFEQHTAAFLGLNASGQVPVLVDRGTAMNESSYICEYLEEAYPAVALMPGDAHGRWQVRLWQKYVDDHVAAAVSELAWEALEARRFRSRGRATLEERIAGIPMPERRDAWTSAVDGYGAEQRARARERLGETVARMETDLARSGWLAGAAYSLADIAVFAYVNYLPRIAPDLASERATPRVMGWLERMRERPGVRAALALAQRPDPFATVAPGPEPIRWG
jgi:glutathione S-transferase